MKLIRYIKSRLTMTEQKVLSIGLTKGAKGDILYKDCYSEFWVSTSKFARRYKPEDLGWRTPTI